MKYIIANWKSNKNIRETKEWFKILKDEFHRVNPEKLQNLTIVVCPSFVCLPQAKQCIVDYSLPIKLGAQNLSSFGTGAFTGEICARMLTDLVEFVIIGHSERRKYICEDDDSLHEKVKQANHLGLKTIYCIQDKTTSMPDNATLIAYEPVWAIGTGKADTPENANEVISEVRQKIKSGIFLYGGSVTAENVKGFINSGQIDGILVGGASLDPIKFLEIIINASTDKKENSQIF